MRLKDLNQYNQDNINRNRISQNGRISYPTVMKYLNGESEEPHLFIVVNLLDGMGVDWREIKLGELIEAS